MALITIAAAATAVVLAALLALGVERERRAVAQRIDRLAHSLSDTPTGAASSSPTASLHRLEDALDQWRTRVVDAQGERRYLAALRSISLGVVLVDESGETVFVNDVAAGFRLGRHGEAVVAQTIDEMLTAAMAGSAAEERMQLYGPPRRRLHVTAAPITHDGAQLGALVLIDDITEQDRIDAMRRDFVTNISHELRTPIGAMSLLAETLVGETDPAIAQPLAERLNKEAERLSATVDDLLELSRIEHGSDAEFEPLALQSVIHGAHDRVRAAAQQRDVEIGVTLPERDLTVLGDRRQLTSAVFNLLDNGVKYCGPGGGTVSVRARAVDDEIELTVQDSGIGIPRKDLDRIFERFYRVDGGRSRMSGGTGLGLSMVRHVVANHGGRVRVESAEGEGATFTIDLPAHPSPGSERPPGDDDHPESAPAVDPDDDRSNDDRPNDDEVSSR